MHDDVRSRLYESYHDTHISYLQNPLQPDHGWFAEYARRHYLPHLLRLNRDSSRVLEIGCGGGQLLEALSRWQFRNLAGIDRSPADVALARQLVPGARIEVGDALVLLESRSRTYDAVIAKAVLEHLRKPEVFRFFEVVSAALDPQGLVLIDVPNMDWCFAPHERYMDFTHETGFTRESLGQVMRQFFSSVQIHPADHLFEGNARDKLKQRFARFVLGRLLTWADGQGGKNPIWARTLIAVGSFASASAPAAPPR